MRLKWDLSAITPLDFLEQILQRLPELHQCSPTQIMTVKRHAKTFIALCATGMLRLYYYQQSINHSMY